MKFLKDTSLIRPLVNIAWLHVKGSYWDEIKLHLFFMFGLEDDLKKILMLC